MKTLNKNSKIYVAGHTGLVGSAIVRLLIKEGYKKIITCSSKKLDLRNQDNTYKFIQREKPDGVIVAAAKVGGIKANNKFKADFIYDNLAIQNNLIHGSRINDIKNLIFLGSSCVYPRNSKQPIKENFLLTGKLEKTNEPYAVAKIAGIKLCESYNFQYGLNYKCLMPSNTYGPNDNYDSFSSHFYSSILKKIFYANLYKKYKIDLWGDGTPKRELIYVDDLASACVFFLKKKTKEYLINIGTGVDRSIKNYAIFAKTLINNKISIRFNNDKSFNGTPRKLLDTSIAKKYKWKPKISLKQGTILTYRDLVKQMKY